MDGRHRAADGGRPAWQVIAAARPLRPAPIADSRTHVAHLVTDESFAEYRHSGRYLVLCGTRVLAASLTVPDRGRCRACIIKVVSSEQ